MPVLAFASSPSHAVFDHPGVGVGVGVGDDALVSLQESQTRAISKRRSYAPFPIMEEPGKTVKTVLAVVTYLLLQHGHRVILRAGWKKVNVVKQV